jgi:hypothetical protein
MDGLSRRQIILFSASLGVLVLLIVAPLLWLSFKVSTVSDNAPALLKAYAASWNGDDAYSYLATEAVEKGIKKELSTGGWSLGIRAKDGSCWIVIVNKEDSVEGPMDGSASNCIK